MSQPTDRPFDVGLQAERTALSWQRTTLAFGVATLVAGRLMTEIFSTLSFIIGAVGIVLMVVVFTVGHRRYRLIHTRLTASSNNRIQLASATPLLFYAAAAFGLGAFGLVFAVVSS